VDALSGKEPTSADVEKILSSVGVEIDSEKLSKVIAELKGKNIDELVTNGRSKLSSMPTGGGVAVAAGTGAAAGAAAPAAEKKEEKEPEKEDSESDDDMGFGLFD